ncbi:DVU_1553 family AMP-dependent CoA ligase [Sulfurospirillum arcachonense]|uniref:DVU_1553 family AMP-dependent CoA ligase n=1 Tax=Sulfurospirillum arcachonense TaxID=57666 RepID=UPI0004681A11|nr:AMP-binding protein [Sulfurospirillum arcachonense]
MKVTPLENWIVERTQITKRSQKALKDYQLEQLINTLKYAKTNSKFYEKHLNSVDISTIKSFEEYERIPFTSEHDIRRDNYDFVAVPHREIERIVTLNTSGTTGDEKRIFFTHEDLEDTIDFFHYGMNCLVDERDKVLVLLPGPSYGSIGDLLKKALEQSNIECIVEGVLSDVEKTLTCIEENNITCIIGIPMQVLYLSRIKPEIFYKHIKKVLLSTDYVPDTLVKKLSNEGVCKVFNHYGMTEMGYGGGVECECLKGYHLRENHLYFEIIDPITQKHVLDGEYGEVVFTTFARQAMPLIRYKTGDMARFSTKPCACGTFLRTMDKVIGRIDNKISLNQHEIHLRQLDELILQFNDVVDYRAEFNEKDALHVKLTLRENFNSKSVVKEIQNNIVSDLDIEVKVEWKWDDYSSSITNSMIKRKIHYSNKGR